MLMQSEDGKIKIRLFGVLADKVSQGFIELEFSNDSESLLRLAYLQFPALAETKFILAINNKVVNSNQQIFKGDEIAFLPPFSGG